MQASLISVHMIVDILLYPIYFNPAEVYTKRKL